MPEPDRPTRVLLIRPSALGDVCRSVPVLVSLKRAFPAARIDWLVRDAFAPAIAAHPDLGRVASFARTDLGNAIARCNPLPAIRFLRSLARERYDLVIDAQGLARSGLFAAATRARRRVGFADARELGWLGVNRRVRVDRSMHTVDRMLALVEGIGIEPVRDLRLHVPEPFRAFPGTIGLEAGRYALLAPTSAWASKRWPADRFAALASEVLGAGLSDRVVFVGGPSERVQCGPLIELASRDARVIDACGRTGVGELMALVAGASLVVANDSAVLHMAVGFDRACVALFGPTRVERVGPYRRERDVIQHAEAGDDRSHKHARTTLIERITIEEVLSAADQRLRRGSPDGPRPIPPPGTASAPGR